MCQNKQFIDELIFKWYNVKVGLMNQNPALSTQINNVFKAYSAWDPSL